MNRFLAVLVATVLTTGVNASGCATLSGGGNYTRSHIDPEGLAAFDGNLGGMQAIYQYQCRNGLYAAISGFWRYGNNAGGDGSRSLLVADIHERIGYTSCCHDVVLTPYLGFGFRHLGHDVKPDVGDRIHLYYNEFYVPVGILSEYMIGRCFSVGLDFVWMPQVFPTVTIGGISDARWVIDRSYTSFNIGLPCLLRFGRVCRWSIGFKPYFERWQDGRTQATTSFGEKLDLPKNTYGFWGIDLNVQYTF